jgi:hypothetical protein
MAGLDPVIHVFAVEKASVDHRAQASGSDAVLRTAMPGDDSFTRMNSGLLRRSRLLCANALRLSQAMMRCAAAFVIAGVSEAIQSQQAAFEFPQLRLASRT